MTGGKAVEGFDNNCGNRALGCFGVPLLDPQESRCPAPKRSLLAPDPVDRHSHEPCLRLLVTNDLLPSGAQCNKGVLHCVGCQFGAAGGDGKRTNQTPVMAVEEQLRGDRGAARPGCYPTILRVDSTYGDQALPVVWLRRLLTRRGAGFPLHCRTVACSL